MVYPKFITFFLFMTVLLISVSGCVEPDGTSICLVENQTLEEDETDLSLKEEYTISQVNAAIDLIEDRGKLAFSVLRAENSEWVHDDSYIFVWKTDGLRVVYPPDVSREGENMSELEDFNDKEIGRIFIETALSEEGEGWVDYYWPKPGDTEPSLKYTFIKRASIDNESYLVGSGFYVDD